ncbi:MAG: hypothetical protein BWY59_01046 [Verrucomicrobia bacterium ADurb.Bin345]|nr:MAG: hypothetical protein BWY59_01046 [Verrucomicrobia bacterium ADurb.Bin345]
MPIREYTVREGVEGCPHCRAGFEQIEHVGQEAIASCPRCHSPVVRKWSAPSISATKTNLDDRAKSAGFKKYKRIGHGEYEKQY